MVVEVEAKEPTEELSSVEIASPLWVPCETSADSMAVSLPLLFDAEDSAVSSGIASSAGGGGGALPGVGKFKPTQAPSTH